MALLINYFQINLINYTFKACVFKCFVYTFLDVSIFVNVANNYYIKLYQLLYKNLIIEKQMFNVKI